MDELMALEAATATAKSAPGHDAQRAKILASASVSGGPSPTYPKSGWYLGTPDSGPVSACDRQAQVHAHLLDGVRDDSHASTPLVVVGNRCNSGRVMVGLRLLSALRLLAHCGLQLMLHALPRLRAGQRRRYLLHHISHVT